MLAIAVSSEANASAVKIAATAQRRSSRGKPSIPGVAGAFAVESPDIVIGLSMAGHRMRHHGRVLRTLAAPQVRGCMMRMRRCREKEGISCLPGLNRLHMRHFG